MAVGGSRRHARQALSAPPEISVGGAPAHFEAGDLERGRRQLAAYPCKSCHVIPGVDGADHLVGPPLAGIGGRRYLAGALPNLPGNMARWIQAPRTVKPRTMMPDLGVTPADARDMAAYLSTLR